MQQEQQQQLETQDRNLQSQLDIILSGDIPTSSLLETMATMGAHNLDTQHPQPPEHEQQQPQQQPQQPSTSEQEGSAPVATQQRLAESVGSPSSQSPCEQDSGVSNVDVPTPVEQA